MSVALLARQRIREVREVLKHDRVAALAELDEIFQQGVAPNTLLDGRFSGQIITTTYQPSMNALVRFLLSAVLPWKGISFDIETGTGDNLVARNVSWLLRNMPGGSRSFQADGVDRYHSFKFNAHIGSSLDYPDQDVLVADYCVDENPALLRRLVAEIVEIGEGYYLGRVLMHQNPCRWICRAYFTLSEIPEGIGQPWLEQVA